VFAVLRSKNIRIEPLLDESPKRHFRLFALRAASPVRP